MKHEKELRNFYNTIEEMVCKLWALSEKDLNLTSCQTDRIMWISGQVLGKLRTLVKEAMMKRLKDAIDTAEKM